MKISEMITHLQALKYVHGDQDCFFYGCGGYHLYDEYNMPTYESKIEEWEKGEMPGFYFN